MSGDPLLLPYNAALVTLACACALLLVFDRQCKFACKSLSCLPTVWDHRFLVPFAVCAAADWLQGPYVYELYSRYGYDRQTINALFVAGFSASLFLGPFVGALADRLGRKAMILLGYCTLYSLACITKHFNSLPVLFLGRLFGGAATSVLFSCFEAWLVSDYARRQLDAAALQVTLSRMYFVNGLMGMLMGIVAHAGANAWELVDVGGSVVHVGGVTVPFDMSLVCLILGMVCVRSFWVENFGTKLSPSETATFLVKIKEALIWLCHAPIVLLLLIGSACTEAAMYCFVIEWTPALATRTTTPPHGVVFSSFMIAFMIGSMLASTFGSFPCHFHSASILCALCTLSTIATAVAWSLLEIYPSDQQPAWATFVIFVCLAIFEACLGGYFATVGALKAKWVPENMRATVYNLFRVPLNLLVVGNELLSPSTKATFSIIVGLLIIALSCFALARSMIRKREHDEAPALESDNLLKRAGSSNVCWPLC